MSEEEENEKFGPKKGIKLTLEQADFLIKRHFPLLRATKISHINQGYNNRVYIVTTTSSTCQEEEKSFILRLCGRFWTRYKTENEVCALLYLGKHGGIPVPKVFGYCTDKEKSGVNAEYILMERMEGECLEDCWSELTFQEKSIVMDQVAEIAAKLQEIPFKEIGSFQLKPSIGNSYGIGVNPEVDIHDDPIDFVKVSKGVEFDGGPFQTYLEYFKSSAETEIQNLKDCPFMKESDGYSERLKRIERLVEAFGDIETIPSKIKAENLIDIAFVFTHGDLEPRNILVDRATLRITAVLDWEFSGAYPIDEEWFTSFRFVNSDTNEERVFQDELRGKLLDETRQEECHLVREYFLGVLRKNRVSAPDDIPGHMIRAELYYFKGFICPWWLREKRDPIPESHYEDRKRACARVDAILDKYGF